MKLSPGFVRWLLVAFAATMLPQCAKNQSDSPKPADPAGPTDGNEPVDPAVAAANAERLLNSTLGRLVANQPGAGLVGLHDWNQAIPSNPGEWIELLDGGTGKVSGLLLPFSMAPQFTSLEKPRIVLTAPEGSAERGRLFIAIAEHGDEEIVEFISWNPVRGAFDFGLIENQDGQRRAVLANEPTCFACHRTRSPIFPEESWDNSVINRSVLSAFVERQAAIAGPGFTEYYPKYQKALEMDRAARAQTPPDFGGFIDLTMSDDEAFAAMTYKGYPFVDSDLMQAFDYNQAIYDAHMLIVSTEWLQTLPNQEHAAQIANEKKLELVAEHPEHYKTLTTFATSPYLLNYNLMAGEVNTYHSLEDVIPSVEHVADVIAYNDTALAAGKHKIPSKHRATNKKAFSHQHGYWEDYLTEESITRTFGENDPAYQQRPSSAAQATEAVAHDQLCSSCHNGAAGSPPPNYSDFNPLIEDGWAGLSGSDFLRKRKLLCATLERISSESAPMPPPASNEGLTFTTYRDSAVLTLQTLVERHEVPCED